jgi:phenylacetate-CoA ligase
MYSFAVQNLETTGATMEETWGMRAVDANFGMADILSIMGSECEHRQGLHFHVQGAVAVELIEPAAGAPLALAEGAEGELMYCCVPQWRYHSRTRNLQVEHTYIDSRP